MPDKNPSPKHRFKKGRSGNPNGRPTIKKGVIEVRRLSAEELIEIVSTLFRATADDVQRTLNDPNEPMVLKIVAQILKKTYETGSMAQFDILLNRAIGKVKDQVTHTIMKPSILVRKDGSEVVFTTTPADEEE